MKKTGNKIRPIVRQVFALYLHWTWYFIVSKRIKQWKSWKGKHVKHW